MNFVDNIRECLNIITLALSILLTTNLAGLTKRTYYNFILPKYWQAAKIQLWKEIHLHVGTCRQLVNLIKGLKRQYYASVWPANRHCQTQL